MYLSYWYAGLYVVCEGWQEAKLSDSEIDALLQSSHLEFLKRFRNGFQADYFDKRFMDALVLGKDFDEWAESLMLAVRALLRRMDKEPDLAPFSGAHPPADATLIRALASPARP